MAVCPNCGNQTGEGAVFCDQCGTRIPAPESSATEVAASPTGGSVVCPACGAGNVPGEAFCDFCGTPLEAPEPAAAVEAEEVPVEAAPPPEAEDEPSPPVEDEPSAEIEDEPSEVIEDVPLPAVEAEEEVEALTCPVCGATVLAGEVFCADCGASLAEPPIPPEPVPDVVEAEETVADEEATAAELEAELEEEIAAVEALAEEAVADEVPTEAATETPPEVAAEETIEVEVLPPPVAVPEPPAVPTCPACGAEVEPGDKFCSNCGAVQEAAPPPEPAKDAAETVPPLPAAGPRLTVVSSGAEIPLPPKQEILIGREDPVSGIFPDVDLTPHGGEEGGVSRQHARLYVEGADFLVEDLDSTNFTFINKQKLAPNTRQAVADGEEIRCGRVALILSAG